MEGKTAKIIEVRKNADGDITDVKLDNSNVYSIDEAIFLAKDGLIRDVNVGRAKNGREFLRADPNGSHEDNLDNLPMF